MPTFSQMAVNDVPLSVDMSLFLVSHCFYSFNLIEIFSMPPHPLDIAGRVVETNEAVTHNEEEADFNCAVDESYLQHLDELEPEEKAKRIQPKGVHNNSLQSHSG